MQWLKALDLTRSLLSSYRRSWSGFRKTHLVAGIWSRHHNIYKRNFFLYFNFITNKYLIAREFKTIFRYIIIITASVQEITKTVVIKIKIALISNQ